MTDHHLWSTGTDSQTLPSHTAATGSMASSAASVTNSSSTTSFLLSSSSLLENSGQMDGQLAAFLSQPVSSHNPHPALPSTINNPSSTFSTEGNPAIQPLPSTLPTYGQPFSKALSQMSQSRGSVAAGNSLNSLSSQPSFFNVQKNRSASTGSTGTASVGTQSVSSSPSSLNSSLSPCVPEDSPPLSSAILGSFLRSTLAASSPVKGYVTQMQQTGLFPSTDAATPSLTMTAMGTNTTDPMSPVDHFLSPSPAATEGCGGYSVGSPASVCNSGSPDMMDINPPSVDIDDSGFSDVNLTDGGVNSSNNNNNKSNKSKRKNKENDSEEQAPSSTPTKRKRVRKSRAKPQDPQQKVIIKRTRRVRANDRERSRMHGLNDAMDELRKHIPNDGSAGKMTKIDTLRTACNYIRVLKMMLGEMEKDGDVADFAGCSWSSGDVVMAAVSNLYAQPAHSPDSTTGIISPGPVDALHSQDLAGRLASVFPSSAGTAGVCVSADGPSPSLLTQGQGQFNFHNHNANGLVENSSYGVFQNQQHLSNVSGMGDMFGKNVNGFHHGINNFVSQNAALDSSHYGSGSQQFSGLSAIGSVFQQSSQCY